mgnify:FL=1
MLYGNDRFRRFAAINAGTVKLVGTDVDEILKQANLLINNPEEYEKMKKAINPYGDGNASCRIADAILYYYGFMEDRPEEFKLM